MGKRKAMAQREPNGRVQRVKLPPPGEVRRLRDAALSGMRDPMWGTEIGRLFLAGKLNDPQFAAGRKWAEMADRYGQAICAPAAHPRAVDLNRSGGQPADPDTEEGAREAERHQRAVDAFLDAVQLVRETSEASLDVLRRVCERGQSCVGHEELLRLVNSLQALHSFWSLTSKRKSDVR